MGNSESFKIFQLGEILWSEILIPSMFYLRKIAHLSSASCPAYQAELRECWNILGADGNEKYCSNWITSPIFGTKINKVVQDGRPGRSLWMELFHPYKWHPKWVNCCFFARTVTVSLRKMVVGRRFFSFLGPAKISAVNSLLKLEGCKSGRWILDLGMWYATNNLIPKG